MTGAAPTSTPMSNLPADKNPGGYVAGGTDANKAPSLGGGIKVNPITRDASKIPMMAGIFFILLGFEYAAFSIIHKLKKQTVKKNSITK